MLLNHKRYLAKYVWWKCVIASIPQNLASNALAPMKKLQHVFLFLSEAAQMDVHGNSNLADDFCCDLRAF